MFCESKLQHMDLWEKKKDSCRLNSNRCCLLCFFLLYSQTYLCNSCGESESCLGWVGGHLSSPSVVGCPSEQGVRPSEKEGAPWRKASSGGLDRKTKPERCPCGHNTSYRNKWEIYKDAATYYVCLPMPVLFKAKLCSIWHCITYSFTEANNIFSWPNRPQTWIF